MFVECRCEGPVVTKRELFSCGGSKMGVSKKHVTHRIKRSSLRYEDPLSLLLLLFLFLFLCLRRILQPNIRKGPTAAAHLDDTAMDRVVLRLGMQCRDQS